MFRCAAKAGQSRADERDKPIAISLGLTGDVYARAHISLAEAREGVAMLEKAIVRAEEKAAADKEEADVRAEIAARKAAKQAEALSVPTAAQPLSHLPPPPMSRPCFIHGWFAAEAGGEGSNPYEAAEMRAEWEAGHQARRDAAKAAPTLAMAAE